MAFIFGLANFIMLFTFRYVPFWRIALFVSALNVILFLAGMFSERLEALDNEKIEFILDKFPAAMLAANAILALLYLYAFLRIFILAAGAGGIAGMGLLYFLMNPFLYVAPFSGYYTYKLVKERRQ